MDEQIIEKAIKEHEKLTGDISELGKVIIGQVCKIALRLKQEEINNFHLRKE